MEGLLNNPYLLAAVGLSLLNIALLIALLWQIGVYRKIQRDLRGEGDGNLESIVLQHKKLLTAHGRDLKAFARILEELVRRNQMNVQNVGLVRYNPFQEVGGNMSFVIALLDGADNGIVISSLHGREGTRIYAKTITKGQSQQALTDEEKQAIISAKPRRT